MIKSKGVKESSHPTTKYFACLIRTYRPGRFCMSLTFPACGELVVIYFPRLPPGKSEIFFMVYGYFLVYVYLSYSLASIRSFRVNLVVVMTRRD